MSVAKPLLPSKIAWMWILILITLSLATSGTWASESPSPEPIPMTVECPDWHCGHHVQLHRVCAPPAWVSSMPPAGEDSVQIRIVSRVHGTDVCGNEPCAQGSRLRVALTEPAPPNGTGDHQEWVVPACGGPSTVTLPDGTVLYVEYIAPAPTLSIRVVERNVVIANRSSEASAEPSPSDSPDATEASPATPSASPSPTP